MPQVHLILAVDVDPDTGKATGLAIEHELSNSPVHFPYGNTYHADREKELLDGWTTTRSVEYQPDHPDADPMYDTAVAAATRAVAGLAAPTGTQPPLPPHTCPCRGRVADAFTDVDGTEVVVYMCGGQAVLGPFGWDDDPTNEPRTNPEEG